MKPLVSTTPLTPTVTAKPVSTPVPTIKPTITPISQRTGTSDQFPI